jgi:hypothetical protein
MVGVALVFASCGAGAGPGDNSKASSDVSSSTTAPTTASSTTTTTAQATTTLPTNPYGTPASLAIRSPLPVPAALTTFGAAATSGEGKWTPVARKVGGKPAVYETLLTPPGGSQPAAIAWMDTHRLFALLYSGSRSPGGGPYRFTAPIQPPEAASLVAAFNGGFIMNVAGGGYYTEGRVIDPLVTGAASFVIYNDGTVNVGAWGSDVTMSARVASVRQNLVPLVDNGQPTALAASSNWQAWGNTCGATSCAQSVPGIENQWRSAAGVTADGALVYATGPGLSPLQLAQLLVQAHAVRGMQLDINPYWTVLATYDPPTPDGLASAANGSKLHWLTTQGPWTFFDPRWNRDFITMSARPGP